jgi:predicted metal-dependent HD superfamily phosphohydrolase
VDEEKLRWMASLWVALLHPFHVHPGGGLRRFQDLANRYNAPDRHYHNFEHVRHVLSAVGWESRPPLATRRTTSAASLPFAAWFHDAIYDSRAKDNEQRSADYAREVLQSLGIPADVREETARLILLTRTHQTTPDDVRGQQLLDADLAILAAEPEQYDAYAAAIRKEYGWVADNDYRAGRRQVLERFLARPRIYFTERMFTAGEARARANLAREIAALSEGVVPAVPGAPGEGSA